MPPLPPALASLLTDLESPSPSLQKLPDLRSPQFGDYFIRHDGGGGRGEVRLRVFTAISNCRTLKRIDLHKWPYLGAVNEAEARALLEGLPSNPVLETLNVSFWQGFGTAAACVALAAIVRSCRCLRTLGLNGVGMGVEGLGHIAGALQANPTSVLETLWLSQNNIGDGAGAQHLARILATTPTLRNLGIYNIGKDVAGAEVIANALAHNSTLEQLSIGCRKVNNADDSAALTVVLAAFSSTSSGVSQGTHHTSAAAFNQSVKYLHLYVNSLAPGLLGEALAQMLRTNATLTFLEISSVFLSNGLEALPHNTSITHLKVYSEYEFTDKVDMEMLIPIIQSCSTLQTLDFSWLKGSTHVSFKRAFFQSLQHKPCITELVLDGWDDLDDDMFKDLMHSLQRNTNLKRISLERTSWKRQGKEATIQQALRRNAGQVAYLSFLKHADMEFTAPKGGRLFLCGSAYAGKTTLRTTLVRSCKSKLERARSWSVAPWSEARRTQGIEIQLLRNDSDMQLTIWDLAGQDKFRALHDHLFPTVTQACVFLFVFSPYDQQTKKLKPDALQNLEEGSRDWLCFIRSKSLTQGHVLPQVSVILTHLDKMVDHTSDTMMDWAMPTITSVTKDFGGVLDISPQVFALKSSSRKATAPLLDSIFGRFNMLLRERLSLVPQPCTHMSTVLENWTSVHPTLPIMRVHEFRRLCQKEVPHLQKLAEQDEKAVDITDAISSYLHDVGTIMFFKDLDFLVVNPNWVTHIFLGQLIKFGEHLPSSDYNMPSTRDGFVTESQLHNVLRQFVKSNKYTGFDEKDLTSLMLKLDLCYEEEEPGLSGVTRYFVPSTLDGADGKALIGMRLLEWPIPQVEADCIHMGRRLQCKDEKSTVLGHGFFPRLQVRLRNRLLDKNLGMKAHHYTNQRNLITFHVDGIQVIVESPGDIADYVDILVRSSGKTHEHTTAFLSEHVMEEVQSFCASPQGSPGVTLVEGIMRPECVSLLTVCAHRRSQSVLKEELISRLLVQEVMNKNCGEIFRSDGSFDYQHTWDPVPEVGLRVAFERARDLLDPGDLLEVLNKNETFLQQQLACIDEAGRVVLSETLGTDGRENISTRGDENRDHERPSLHRSMSDIAASSHSHRMVAASHLEIVKKLNMMDKKLDVIKSLQEQTLQKLDIIKALQDHTLVTVLSKMDEIMDFSAELVASVIPRRPYFTTDDVGIVHKLVAGVHIGNAMMLHFMCEDTGGNHLVEGQVGHKLTVDDAKWNWIWPIAVGAVRLLVFLVKAGLHVAAGIGDAVPDFPDSGKAGLRVAARVGDAIPLTVTALAGETLLNDMDLKLPGSYVEQSKYMEEAWILLKEEMKPLLEGQMRRLFQLYRVRFTGGPHQRIAWVCKKCLDRGRKKGILCSV